MASRPFFLPVRTLGRVRDRSILADEAILGLSVNPSKLASWLQQHFEHVFHEYAVYSWLRQRDTAVRALYPFDFTARETRGLFSSILRTHCGRLYQHIAP